MFRGFVHVWMGLWSSYIHPIQPDILATSSEDLNPTFSTAFPFFYQSGRLPLLLFYTFKLCPSRFFWRFCLLLRRRKRKGEEFTSTFIDSLTDYLNNNFWEMFLIYQWNHSSAHGSTVFLQETNVGGNVSTVWQSSGEVIIFHYILPFHFLQVSTSTLTRSPPPDTTCCTN